MEPTQNVGQTQAALPNPEDSRTIGGPFGVSDAEAESIAKAVYDEYRFAKARRRRRDLTAEKYLLHIDGEGDGQWADIVDGSRVEVPPAIPGGIRLQHNLLRPLTENAVAYHTAQKFAVIAESEPGREARDRARIDTAFANALIRRTGLNNIVAEALLFAAPYGHCPVHAAYRDDLSADPYEPLTTITDPQGRPDMTPEEEETGDLRRGGVSFWAGDPWATVYNEGARRSSVSWMTYDRVFSAQVIRETFQRGDIEGRDDLPSASRQQRIVRKWLGTSPDRHGTAGIDSGMPGGEELVGILSKEIAPGMSTAFPKGALVLVAISGASEADPTQGLGGRGRPVLLHIGPLPGGRFSATRFYMGNRGDDVLGKPYAGDLDDLQVQLNQLITLEQEFVRRFARPPFVVGPGGLVDDTVVTDDDAILELASDTQVKPGFLFPPQTGQNIYSGPIERVMDQMFRLGGWQAASRGESNAGDPAAKVVALMRADDTIFGPVNERIRESVGELLQTAHALTREFQLLPLDTSGLAGDDLIHLHEPYISREQLSERPPEFSVVSGQGATPEHTMQQLLQMVQIRGGDGKPLLSTEEFWRRWPDPTLRPPELTADHLRTQKALRVNWGIQKITDALLEQFQGDDEMAGQFVPYALQQIGQLHPIERTDNPQLHIETLDLIVQDPDEHPIARQIARMRQFEFFQVLQMQQMQAQQAQQEQEEGPKEKQSGPPARRSAGRGSGGSAESPAGVQMPKERVADESVRALTNEAMAQA